MNIAQLRYFVAAVETGSFAAAARREYVAPQTASRAVADLEAELGAALFVRTGRSIEPTPCAREVAAVAAEALRAIDAIPAIVAKDRAA